jgi:Flp pilus assembly protein TadG
MRPINIVQGLRQFLLERRANVAMTMGLAAVGLIGVAGLALDYTSAISWRSRLQDAADAAALAGAKEFRLSNTAQSTVVSVARTFAETSLDDARAALNNLKIAPAADFTAKTVTVAIDADVKTSLMGIFGFDTMHVEASATARVIGGPPICVIGLDSSANSTVALDKNARLEAGNCSVYSNSQKANGLMAKNSSVLKAAFICSAGGKSGAGPGSFTPEPQTDCPVLADPLASRPQPSISGCDKTATVIHGGAVTLSPGVYCGGVSADAGAAIKLQSGIYVFRDGPLSISGSASLTGANVGLFLSGKGATLNFASDSSISLTAPQSGAMAGMLIAEDRASPTGQIHQILSNDARILLGTIYLPQNRLHVAAQQPIADKSAYTIVVARTFTLSEGPTMVLNTNYDSTDIPVPQGVGPNANRTALSH